ncbi:MAG: cytochrome b/b6 domain-containing protein [Bacteroidales bacterium]|nr:cytochrome b/b6 domain-containing protein [Bacteroidales bacterium]
MKDQIYLYPVWVRLWHLFNALLFLALIITGLCLQYANINYTLIPFNYSVSIHNISGIVLSVAFVFFLFANHFTPNGNYYRFPKHGVFAGLIKQFRHYSYGIFKGEECPFPVSVERKFNPLQKISYVIIMYILMPIIIATGLGLFFPDFLPPTIFGASGIHFIDLIHIITGFALSIFMLVHIYFCTIGKTPLSNFKSMITGWH